MKGVWRESWGFRGKYGGVADVVFCSGGIMDDGGGGGSWGMYALGGGLGSVDLVVVVVEDVEAVA